MGKFLSYFDILNLEDFPSHTSAEEAINKGNVPTSDPAEKSDVDEF